MINSSEFQTKRIPLNHGAGYLPVLGFGTLIPDAVTTISATRDAMGAGRHRQKCMHRSDAQRGSQTALLRARQFVRECSEEVRRVAPRSTRLSIAPSSRP